MKNGIFLAACVSLVLHAGTASHAQGPLEANGQGPAQPQQQQQLPAPFQITEQEAKYIDDILKFWEFRSGKVHHYEAKFERWEYDSQFGPADVHKTYSQGEVKYEKPDKGMFKVESILHWTKPQESGQQATYQPHPGEVMEHWVCDGKSVFEFDVTQKKLKEYPLPPEQQGQAIAHGPLPFLFGAKRQEIWDRFHLRVSTPEGVNNEYWLEAWPKYAADAAEYRFIEIIIDQEQFLPKAISVYDRAFNPKAMPPNTSRTVYEFSERKPYEERGLAANLQQLFRRAFFEPQLPSGWQREVIDPAAMAGAARPAHGQPSGAPLGAPNSAQRSSSLPR